VPSQGIAGAIYFGSDGRHAVVSIRFICQLINCQFEQRVIAAMEIEVDFPREFTQDLRR
jgi:hypothetical protein